MRVLCVIPARLGSTRLPRKMLANVNGQPMIQRTYLGAKKCAALTKVVVATDSNEIAAVVKEVGAEVVMTSTAFTTGSDRVAHVARAYTDMDVVINLQGDEPFIKAEMLQELIKPYETDENLLMATLGFKLNFPDEYHNPNIVKVILDNKGYAIYFSRSPIPYFRHKIENMPVLHHMGIYAFQRNFLLQFTTWPQTLLEKAESLEQLRAIEHGYKIKVTETQHRTLEINNAEELIRAQAFVN